MGGHVPQLLFAIGGDCVGVVPAAAFAIAGDADICGEHWGGLSFEAFGTLVETGL